MSTKIVTDNGGKTLKMTEHNGLLFTHTAPQFDITYTNNVKARPEDILMVGYPKSGTHWMFGIINYLLAGHTDIPKEDKNKFNLRINLVENYPSPRFLNTHFRADTVSEDFITQNSRIVYFTRNPRDVAVSFFHHLTKKSGHHNYSGEWKDYLQMFMEGTVPYNSWFDHTKGWEKVVNEHPNNKILVLNYEDMKQDLERNVTEISQFLGYKHSKEFLKEVAEKTTFTSMAKMWKGDERDRGIFRKGIVGGWKSYFTEEQLKEFNDKFEREMAGTHAYNLYSHTLSANNNTTESSPKMGATPIDILS